MTWCISSLGEINAIGYCMILLFMILLDIIIEGSVLPASTEVTEMFNNHNRCFI